MNEANSEFSGVFMFTNPMKRKWVHLWNNKEYSFEPESTSPLIIQNETLENIQEIRKRFAKDNAIERLYEGEKVYARDGKTVVFDYKKAKEMGNGIPPTFDEKILEPMIEECLKPFPIKKVGVKEGKKIDDESNYKATKAGFVASPAEVFKEDENRESFGQMSDR